MKKQPMKAKRKHILIGISAAVLVLIGSVLFYVDTMLSKIQYSDGGDAQALEIAHQEDEEASDSPDSSPEEVQTTEQAIMENLTNNSTALRYDDHVLNILLIGCDSRTEENVGRSDSMILLSINQETKKIIMTSIMRDIYAYIPGYGNNRLNSAFAFGGASLLLDTLETNFGIQIEKYVLVNFYSFIDIIDAIGGVSIPVSAAELSCINSGVRGINAVKKLPADDGILPEAGDNLLLYGKQALSYCRIRHVGNADYERTERQRRVLSQLIEKCGDLNIVELNNLLNILLPSVTTNFQKEELYSLILSYPTMIQYEVEQDRIPIDGSYQSLTIRKMSVLGIDFEKNKQELQQKIYGQES